MAGCFYVLFYLKTVGNISKINNSVAELLQLFLKKKSMSFYSPCKNETSHIGERLAVCIVANTELQGPKV